MASPVDGAANVVVAVDANGADLGPAEVAAGAAIAARHGVRTLLFGPADKFGEIDAPEGLVARNLTRSDPAATSFM